MSYWDTSALAKLYVAESDSAIFERKSASERERSVTARVTLPEMRRVAFRKEADGLLRPRFAETILQKLAAHVQSGGVRVVESDLPVLAEFDRIIAACYRRNPALRVRTLDALHLASARVAGQSEIVATDRRLREAALFLGFSLFPA
ncbi:MAG TPA: type II toxin-antitoxin system VapC family toxin [Dongiaceae bacterium]|nr:type II toxin-antitoxin system VapC family toxin [Dongiaceae bacterium]